MFRFKKTPVWWSEQFDQDLYLTYVFDNERFEVLPIAEASKGIYEFKSSIVEIMKNDYPDLMRDFTMEEIR